jgi:hypothetical protein
MGATVHGALGPGADALTSSNVGSRVGLSRASKSLYVFHLGHRTESDNGSANQ